MLKKCQIVLLPTEKAENCILKVLERLYYHPERFFTQAYLHAMGKKSFHLYVLSDDEIKESDWVLKVETKSIFHVQPVTNKKISAIIGNDIPNVDEVNNGRSEKGKLFKKIIATTDRSLTIKAEQAGENAWYNPLPQPSELFIQNYIDEYNKGNVISEVMVEYELQTYIDNGKKYHYSDGRTQVKINPNKTINIKPIKNNWTRKELIPLFKKYGEDLLKYIKESSNEGGFEDRWTEQNL